MPVSRPCRPRPACATTRRAAAWLAAALLVAPASAEIAPPPGPDPIQAAILDCLDAATAAGGDPGGAGARACIGREAGACGDLPENQTTVGMMRCAEAERDAWDGLLNLWWKPLRAQALKLDADGAGESGLPGAAAALLEAQRAWLAFRDAECRYDYALGGGGTIRQILGADCQLRLTAERALRLRERLAAR